ncbi:MAG: tetratricopeptide repeat protein [Thermodesulfobacteriota bacterium]
MDQTLRTVRVFISSTFRDMHEEREELIKRIFPQLRKLCESRGVVWGEVDLRWGITGEAKAEGQVLPICLAEIHRCRPYFIGLLGERYGWVPDEIPQELIAQEPWLKEHLHRSVTELEILHGVLRNPEMADHAFFYFRDPAYVASLDPEKRADFTEAPYPEDIARFGPEEAQRRAEGRRGKLAALKERIRQSGLPLRENYRAPRDLGQLVLRDLTEVIDRLFPEGSQLAPLDREAAEHEAYARSRAVVEVRPGEFSGVYIAREKYLEHLDDHAQGDGPPLVVLGDSGVGKSALLANWALRYRPRHTQDLLIMHFIGAGPHSADWAAMLRRIMGELKRRFEIPQDIPDQPDALRLAFANFLSMAAAQGKVVLIIDALNQLEDKDGAPDLVWLPPVLPANVRLILSTLPGRPLDVLTKRGWPALTVEPLEVPERRRLIRQYLDQYRKELSTPELERLAAAPPTANPLYLRALLEELRVYGDHYTLKARLDHYLTAPDVKSLYELILARYEEDYQRDRPGLVGEAMSLIAAARRGLSQAELLDLLGEEREPLPGAIWSPLFLAAEHALMDRSGLISFGHDYFRQAVRDRYLNSKEKRQTAHLRLADYFDRQDLEIAGRPNYRKIDELPWQLAAAKNWGRLFDLLANLNFFTAAWELTDFNQFQVRKYWAEIEAHSQLRMIDAYFSFITNPNAIRDSGAVFNIARLFWESGRVKEARPLMYHLVERYRTEKTNKTFNDILLCFATLLLDAGETGTVEKINVELEQKCCELDDEIGIALCTINQSEILRIRGKIPLAIDLLEDAAKLLRRLNRKVELAKCLVKLAQLKNFWGQMQNLPSEVQQANTLLEEVERLSRESGDDATRAYCLNAKGVGSLFLGELKKALDFHQQEELLCRSQGDLVGLQRALGSQAIVQYQSGQLQEAVRLYDQAIEICRQIDNKEGLACCVGGKGRVVRSLGHFTKAMELQKQEEKLCWEFGGKMQLACCLFEQAITAHLMGDFQKAEELKKEAQAMFEETNIKL